MTKNISQTVSQIPYYSTLKKETMRSKKERREYYFLRILN